MAWKWTKNRDAALAKYFAPVERMTLDEIAEILAEEFRGDCTEELVAARLRELDLVEPPAEPDHRDGLIEGLQERIAILERVAEERNAYVESIEQKALRAIRERNEVEERAMTPQIAREIEDAIPRKTEVLVDLDLLRSCLRRVALALAVGDVPRAHRGINDAIASAQIPLEMVTEATMLSQVELFDQRIQSALELIGIVTIGDLVETSEERLREMARMCPGYTLGANSFPVVFDGRRKVRRVIDRSAAANAGGQRL